MARKRKKVVNNRTNQTAGDSRFSVLTDDDGTYNPFKDLNKKDYKVSPKKKNEPIVQKKKIEVEQFGENVDFGDILDSWESSRSLKDVGKKTKIKEPTENFASIFEQWEKDQGIAPKTPNKKKSPPKKSKEYKPSKNFEQILNEFEGTAPLKKKEKIEDNKPVVKETVEKKEKIEVEEKKEIKEPFKFKIISHDDSKNIKLENTPSQKDNIIDNKKPHEDIKTTSDIKKDFEKKTPDVSWKAEKKLSNKYQKENEPKKKPFKPMVKKVAEPKEEVPSKWDFSDIYSYWNKNNDEEKRIEKAINQKDKKENKGISISYLHSMSPQAELDLHGVTSEIAISKTKEFLVNSRNAGMKKVSIITGKGNHSENGISVLQDVVLSQIRLSGIVREAYHPKNRDGGTGAIWVIFKSMTDKKIYFK